MDTAEQAGDEQSDAELRAGALRGQPAELAAYARRLELVPKLLAAWNVRLEEPLAAAELSELAESATIALWQDLPQFTAAEPLDLWLARSAAQHLRLDTDEDAASVLEAAHSIDDAPGQTSALDALARYRAEQKLRPSHAGEKQRSTWAVIGVLGVIATFLAVSPYSPLRPRGGWTLPSPGDPAPQDPGLGRKIVPIAPLEAATLVKEFRWAAPKGLRCLLLVESMRGTSLVRATGILSGVFPVEQALPPGRLRWQVIPESDGSDVPATGWIEFDHGH